ncbi:MAG: glycosyltransferase family 39 protein, partial [Candidatus Symbiothrix sp.]|nr:glycosyltransferase family 39 protein [Candidatus Symbiothrix sp.]
MIHHLLVNTSVFSFGLLHFIIMWRLVYLSTKKDWRSSFISSALYCGVVVWSLTELLSYFKMLDFTGILCGWIGYDVCLLSFLFYKHREKVFLRSKLSTFSIRWEYFFLGFILFVTFFIAVVYPPNNWDSQTYHLPKIEHWLQNKSLNHDYTSITRQVILAPFAEMVIMHGRVLSGGDWLMNLVQWGAFLGTIIVVSKIASRLGLNKTMQIATMLFFATVPMAILQASSTQTDLVEAFWIVCLAERLLAWKKEGTLRQSIDFGIALGLAILTKGTAYSIAFPFVIIFAIISLRKYRNRLAKAFVAASICLILNTPHYIRNYIAFNDILGVPEGTASNFSVQSFFITALSDIYANIPFPVPYYSNEFTVVLENVDKTIYPCGIPYIYSGRGWISHLGGTLPFHEDSVSNTFHLLLIIITVVLSFRNKNSKKYMLIVLGSWGMFAFCIPWQPWITRLQVPLFALSAPIFALALKDRSTFKNFCLFVLCFFAL